MSFDFWWKWLLVVSVCAVLVGLMLAFFPQSALLAAHTAAIERVFFDGAMPADAHRLRTFLFGPLGGTIAGYFLLQAFIVWRPFRRRERWAWQATAGSVLLWFVVDSSVSLAHGAVFNVWMVNVWTLLLMGLPLLMTRRAFLQPVT